MKFTLSSLKITRTILNITVFISAFLLFSLEPLFGKRILPWYGGIPNVWIALMTLYMGIMCLGNLYTLFIHTLSIPRQLIIHKVVIVSTLFFIIIHTIIWHSPILPQTFWQQFSTSSPALSISLLAFFHIGLPFFLLATTSTILQSWDHIISKNTPKSTYSLYAISNLGSFIGLLAYPILIEPLFTIQTQAIIWGVLYLCFVICMLFIIKIIKNRHIRLRSINTLAPHPSLLSNIVWISLSFLSTLSLLATTNHITQAVAPIAFFWLVPLALYLLSFIVTFSNVLWYEALFHPVLLLFLLLFTILFYVGVFHVTYFTSLAITILTMWLLMLITHKTLYNVRPHQQNSPNYYFAISIGSLIAALFCSYIAPYLFSNYWEYPLSLLAGGILCILISFFHKISILQKLNYILTGLIIIIIMVINFYNFLSNKPPLQGIIANKPPLQSVLTQKRNFFGVTRVTKMALNEHVSEIVLYNGTIQHGKQLFNNGYNYEPTTYYTADSGVGQAITKHSKRLQKPSLPLRIAGIGLGVGTITAFCEPNDYFHFYEINPEVVRISQTYFTYISNCRQKGGKVEITTGDARISLTKESKSGRFDVIVVDAFTDDAIPTHLLTKEAIQTYLFHLESEGIIAIHISNILFDFKPVIYQHALVFNLFSYYYFTPGSEWVLLSQKPLYTAVKLSKQKDIGIWTDDYTSIFQIFKK